MLSSRNLSFVVGLSLIASQCLAAEGPWQLGSGLEFGGGGIAWSTSATNFGPVSELRYKDGYLAARVEARYQLDQPDSIMDQFQVYIRGRFGLVLDGSLRDYDWAYGFEYSDTVSDIDTDSPLAQISAGVNFPLFVDDYQRVGALVGLTVNAELLHAKGVRYIGPALIGLDSSTFWVDSIKVNTGITRFGRERAISNWFASAGPDVGLSWEFSHGRLGLQAELSAQPLTGLYMRDRHHLRTDFIGSKDLVLSAPAYGAAARLGASFAINDTFNFRVTALGNGLRSYDDEVEVEERPVSILSTIDTLRRGGTGIPPWFYLWQQGYDRISWWRAGAVLSLDMQL